MEELAAFNKHTAIEEMLFVRRMCGKTRVRLASFFTPEALMEAHRRASEEGTGPANLLDFDGDLGELSTDPSSHGFLHFSVDDDSDELPLCETPKAQRANFIRRGVLDAVIYSYIHIYIYICIYIYMYIRNNS